MNDSWCNWILRRRHAFVFARTDHGNGNRTKKLTGPLGVNAAKEESTSKEAQMLNIPAIARKIVAECLTNVLGRNTIRVHIPLDILHALADGYTIVYEWPSIPMSPRYQSNAYTRAKFVLDRTEDTDVYPGQVQYFIEHALAGMIHRLAIVKWYRPVRPANARYRLGLDGDPQFCNSELWSDTFYPLNRESILPVHNILGRFVRVPTNASNKSKNALDCITVVPLNRRFNL